MKAPLSCLVEAQVPDPLLGHGYMVELLAFNPKDSNIDRLTISAAWTRGLAAHPFGKFCLYPCRRRLTDLNSFAY